MAKRKGCCKEVENIMAKRNICPKGTFHSPKENKCLTEKQIYQSIKEGLNAEKSKKKSCPAGTKNIKDVCVATHLITTTVIKLSRNFMNDVAENTIQGDTAIYELIKKAINKSKYGKPTGIRVDNIQSYIKYKKRGR